MAVFKPFRAYRPAPINAFSVASRPYDVLNSSEARHEADGNPKSFLHVIKPEIGLPENTNPYSEEVYQHGADVFNDFKSKGVLSQDANPCFYIYRLTMDGRTQTGVVGCCNFEEYFSGQIKKHELTRVAKEEDRVKHVEALNANAEPVFFSYRAKSEINDLIDQILAGPTEYDFVAADKIRHELWVVDDESKIVAFEKLFEDVPSLYVADGHHRTAAAARIGQKRKESNPKHTGDEEYNLFLAVLFSDQELEIFDYNRVVKDLNGLSESEFISEIKKCCSVVSDSPEPIRPSIKGDFSVYIANHWYCFRPINITVTQDPVSNLDVSYLSDVVFGPILGIKDQRKDERIDFVGGIRGLEELERRVNSGEMTVAFALYPASMSELLAVADAGKIMPPKSTWFEPKLRSGLFVHELE
jgi:uncharacterized protein (DUF1015 family)